MRPGVDARHDILVWSACPDAIAVSEDVGSALGEGAGLGLGIAMRGIGGGSVDDSVFLSGARIAVCC